LSEIGVYLHLFVVSKKSSSLWQVDLVSMGIVLVALSAFGTVRALLVF
tara:strand:+ start:765 stop:908 length:144 start_codon:yes stop_codon:yes gene_type:complete